MFEKGHGTNFDIFGILCKLRSLAERAGVLVLRISKVIK